MMRELLKQTYLDWVNNYVSVRTYADHNGLTVQEAESLLELAGAVYNHPHPDE